MVQLIVGNKGSGKTKTLIRMVNEAVETSNGNVVCVEKGSVMTFDINYQARLVDIDDYAVDGFDTFYGFIAGLCACNYDITDLFIDATLRIGGRDYAAFAKMVEKLNVPAFENINITFTVSCDASELPDSIKSFILS